MIFYGEPKGISCNFALCRAQLTPRLKQLFYSCQRAQSKIAGMIYVTMRQAIVSYFKARESVFKKSHIAFRLRLWKNVKRHLLLAI